MCIRDRVKACLNAAEIPFSIDPRIVRGLDYYTRTVFEFISDALGSQSTVCGGGRYDGLTAELGGPALPSLGFGMEMCIRDSQEPDSNDLGWGMDHDFSRSYTWLMLFQDGCRIDLHIETVEAVLETYGSDTLTLPLLDKDGILRPLPPPDDSGYRVTKPGNPQYDGCCNEFWWCLNNVAKGLVRGQLPYAMRMYTGVVHPELERMTAWYIGTETDFGVSVGMWGKYFQKLLPPPLYARYASTYAAGDSRCLWNAVFEACALFRELARAVGGRLGYPYPEGDDAHMTRYLLQMQAEYINKIRQEKPYDTENP